MCVVRTFKYVGLFPPGFILYWFSGSSDSQLLLFFLSFFPLAQQIVWNSTAGQSSVILNTKEIFLSKMWPLRGSSCWEPWQCGLEWQVFKFLQWFLKHTSCKALTRNITSVRSILLWYSSALLTITTYCALPQNVWHSQCSWALPVAASIWTWCFLLSRTGSRIFCLPPEERLRFKTRHFCASRL